MICRLRRLWAKFNQYLHESNQKYITKFQNFPTFFYQISVIEFFFNLKAISAKQSLT